jgi:hypothetical protein
MATLALFFPSRQSSLQITMSAGRVAEIAIDFVVADRRSDTVS